MSKIKSIYFLHILNDGFESSLILLLPFIVKEININLYEVGLLSSTLSVLHVILALPAGILAYKFGSTKMLLFALLIYSLGFVSVSFSPVYLVLIFSYIFSGFGFGIFHPIVFADLANRTDKTNRGTMMGSFAAIGDVGRIGFAPVITLLIGYIGWRYTSLTLSFIGILCFVMLFKMFKRNNDFIVKKKVAFEATHNFKSLLKNKRFMYATIANFVDSFASSSLFVFLPFLLIYRNIDLKVLGIFSSVFFLGNFLGRTFLGKLSDTIGNVKIFMISELIMSGFIFILASSSNTAIIILSSFILGAFTKGTVPVLATMISDSVEKNNNFEKAFALDELIKNFAIVLSPIFIGLISDKLGIAYALSISAALSLMAIIPSYLYSKESVIDVMKNN